MVRPAEAPFADAGIWCVAAEEAERARAEAAAARQRDYAVHGWNINNLPRHQGSVLRYLEGDELITGVQVRASANFCRMRQVQTWRDYSDLQGAHEQELAPRVATVCVM